MSDLKTCFVIAPIGEADTDIRKRSDTILKYIITPAANECGFEPLRADRISEPGMITSDVIQHIIDDPLVIADLTGRNPNVYYELAIRHAIRKPCIQLIANDEQLPFDVAGTRTIKLDHHDLQSASEARVEIVKQIIAVMKDPSKVDSPISMSLDLQNLRQSEVPEQRSLADIIEAISEVNLGIKNIQSAMVSDPILQDKKRFREMSFIIEEVHIRIERLSKELERIFTWAIPTDLDEKEKAIRELEFSISDKELHNIYRLVDQLRYLLNS